MGNDIMQPANNLEEWSSRLVSPPAQGYTDGSKMQGKGGGRVAALESMGNYG